MATLIIPDNTTLADLDRIAQAMGKRLRYRAQPITTPAPEGKPHGHHTHATDRQPAAVLADH